LFVNLPDFSVSRSHSHPSDAFYYSVDVTPVAAVAASWLPSLCSLSERHCRVGRYNVTVMSGTKRFLSVQLFLSFLALFTTPRSE
jgi:hypothetical protein